MQIDILINNAGRSQRAWIAETELAVDREMIDLNVIGQVSLTKSVLPHMIKRRSGHIVITSSLAAKMGQCNVLLAFDDLEVTAQFKCCTYKVY